ncbi:hypothetical protein Pint_26812 [Pistacia integerrima]|uniref:Uncharacterized protein n=1 Tax=Pistacia integerrima TaxID=434235 RepID=A0ACC0YRH9_9ROSI|nr:hypothetical protein Pint_26812 [Pistacia integerrima]
MSTKFKIEKFNEVNFSLWKLRIKAILRKDNCLATIGGVKPVGVTDNKWKEMDDNAMSNLLYEVKSLHNKIFLKRRLYTIRMSESTSMTDHINNLNTIFSQLSALDHNIAVNERAKILFQSLPDSYDQLIINLTNNVLIDYLVFDEVAAAVLEEESRRKNKEDRSASSQQAEALLMTRGRSMERGSSGSHNHGRSQSRSKKNVKCYHCGKKGHVKKDCWHYKKSTEKTHEATNSQ